MNKIIKGDQVVVITGKDKGKQGQVVRVLGSKVVVEGVNVVGNKTEAFSVVEPFNNTSCHRVLLSYLRIKMKKQRK